RAVHREHPRRIRIARMHHDAEADVANLPGHVVADSQPLVAGAIDPVDAAVILLVEPIGSPRMQAHAMYVLSVLRIWIGQKVHLDAAIERAPRFSLVVSLKRTTAGGNHIHVRRIT